MLRVWQRTEKSANNFRCGVCVVRLQTRGDLRRLNVCYSHRVRTYVVNDRKGSAVRTLIAEISCVGAHNVFVVVLHAS